jgi:plastocyanin
MTDTTTTDEPAEAAEVEGATRAEAEAVAPTPPEKPPFWDRPLVERFLVPLVLPIAVVVGLVVYIINISRLFLSGHEHIPVIVGTVITLIILGGATLVSASAHRLRPGSLVLFSVGFLMLIISSGWLVIGHAENKEETLEALSPDLQAPELSVTAAPGGALAFAPNSLDGETGLIKFNINVAAGGHTFAFTDASTLLASPLQLEPPGATVPGVGYFAEEGDYEFICTIPGHAAGGMKGTLHVEGEAVPTLDEALVKAGNPAGAGGGEGG